LPKSKLFLIAAAATLLIWLALSLSSAPESFDAERAFKDLEYQVLLGPRIPGSDAHAAQLEWMGQTLVSAGWAVEIHKSAPLGNEIFNLVAKKGNSDSLIIVGAHFDTRPIADSDPNPENHNLPILGANDGASGVAVLLELARVIPENLDSEIWLVFFDAEDGFGIPGWGLSLGSKAFVVQLDRLPKAVVIVDMVGDAELALPIDGASNPELVAEIWAVAADLGYEDIFQNEIGYYIIDDHTPFNEAGIPAIDIIDFDYPYWHTLQDTVDKVSAQSLQVVGDTILAWLKTK
jgi:Zn-dependent M28 family amino/carboxypeptidase